jgi:hypothetical protein
VIANLIYSSTFATASEGLTPIAKVNLPPRCRLPTGKYAANAALIAAAPDLLAACGEALRVLEDETRPQTTAREMLRAAIAKARGGR